MLSMPMMQKTVEDAIDDDVVYVWLPVITDTALNVVATVYCTADAVENIYCYWCCQ